MVPRIPGVKKWVENLQPKVLAAIFKKKCHPCMSIFQLPPLRCPCKDFSISLFLHPNNLCWRIFVKFFSKPKFRVYNAVSSLAIRVWKRVTRYNWHGNNLYAVSICHFCRLAKYSLRARCLMKVVCTAVLSKLTPTELTKQPMIYNILKTTDGSPRDPKAKNKTMRR